MIINNKIFHSTNLIRLKIIMKLLKTSRPFGRPNYKITEFDLKKSHLIYRWLFMNKLKHFKVNNFNYIL